MQSCTTDLVHAESYSWKDGYLDKSSAKRTRFQQKLRGRQSRGFAGSLCLTPSFRCGGGQHKTPIFFTIVCAILTRWFADVSSVFTNCQMISSVLDKHWSSTKSWFKSYTWFRKNISEEPHYNPYHVNSFTFYVTVQFQQNSKERYAHVGLTKNKCFGSCRSGPVSSLKTLRDRSWGSPPPPPQSSELHLNAIHITCVRKMTDLRLCYKMTDL